MPGLEVQKFEKDKNKRNTKEKKSENSNNLFVQGFPTWFTDDDLKNEFNDCGKVTSVFIKKDKRGNSTGTGFVCYSNSSEAKRA